ncbi:MAG: hypothetical protein C0506_04950 [Anaerolinea sp.]|nr:hypothetical protein [Anaerolinea sp.]
MEQNPLEERKNTLEEEFFRKQNAEAIARLRTTQDRAQAREAMAATSGISDGAVLDRLIDQGLNPASLAAVALVPLVAVAWADRKIEEKERRAVLEVAASSGLTSDMPGYELLDSWLRQAPPPSLLATWADYARALAASMEAGDRRDFRNTLLARAKTVATAAGGGFAGRGSKVSGAEEAVLRSVEEALAG